MLLSSLHPPESASMETCWSLSNVDVKRVIFPHTQFLLITSSEMLGVALLPSSTTHCLLRHVCFTKWYLPILGPFFFPRTSSECSVNLQKLSSQEGCNFYFKEDFSLGGWFLWLPLVLFLIRLCYLQFGRRSQRFKFWTTLSEIIFSDVF